MNKALITKNFRWALIIGAILILVLGAGALYAQGYGNKGGGRNMPGPGGGRGGRMDGGQGGFRQGMNGGHRLGGLMYLMEDPEIRETMMEIRSISAINELGLDSKQVESLLKDAREAQSLVDSMFGSARNEVKGVLKDQLDAVAKGETFDKDAFQSIKEKCMGQNPGEIKDQLKPILDHAMGLLTDEQKATFSGPGMGRGMGQDNEGQGRMRDRFQQRGKRFNQGQDDNRGDGMGRQPGDIKMMMFLMNPKSVDAMEKWLSAH